MSPVFKNLKPYFFPAGWIPQRMETTGCVSTTASVNCHRRWCSLRWSLIVRAAQVEAERSGRTWPWQRAWWTTNWRISGWEGGKKTMGYTLQITLALSDVILLDVYAPQHWLFHPPPVRRSFPPLSGKDGHCVPAPGEEPSGAGFAAGLWGEGPLPPGGQPVAGVLLVLPQPACHAHRRCHSNLHPATPLS